MKEVNSTLPPANTVICLHGLGASGSDLVMLADFLGREKTRYVFPDAPKLPVTINGGYVMRAWHDITSLEDYVPDHENIEKSSQIIRGLIADEQSRYGIASENITLLGFSQGAAMALHVGLNYHLKISSIVALSGYPVLGKGGFDSLNETNQSTPIFLGHGMHDDVVPVNRSEYIAEVLLAKNYNLQLNKYAMRHEISLEEMQDIKQWLIP